MVHFYFTSMIPSGGSASIFYLFNILGNLKKTQKTAKPLKGKSVNWAGTKNALIL